MTGDHLFDQYIQRIKVFEILPMNYFPRLAIIVSKYDDLYQPTVSQGCQNVPCGALVGIVY